MGWFEYQIEERREADQRLLEESFVRVAGVIMDQRAAQQFSDERIITKNAIDEILKYYHFPTVEVPQSVKRGEDQLDYCLRPHGIMRRTVKLTAGWYRDAYGPILGFLKEDGSPAALLPGRFTGYVYTDPRTGQRQRLNKKTAALFDDEALCFYRPLPQKKLGISDLLLYMKRSVTLGDFLLIAAAALAVTLAGMLMPRITQLLTGPVLASGQTDVLLALAICVACVAVSSQLFSATKTLLIKRMDIKTSVGVQASMIMRLMSLPAAFFRRYSPGELKSRSMAVNQLCSLLMNILLSTGLTSMVSLLYLTQIFRFAPTLVGPAMLIILVTVALSAASAFTQAKVSRRWMELAAKEAGMSYAMISGVQKIRLSGAEKRIFAKWMDLYSQGAEVAYRPPMLIRLNKVISTAISLGSNIALYYLAVRDRVSPADYYAFTAAYGTVMGAFLSLSDVALSTAQIRPILEMAEPILKAEPETAEGRQIVTRISGGIELEHVDFRYDEQSPYIFRDLSLKIRPGEYVAIVGRTGCGKSTLMRLLLGFEQPEKGAIYYDGKDLRRLDLPSLRKKIGTVMQNSGLFQGDIYSNIVISAPELTPEDAWQAAEAAGIADDIRAMPMGMHTVVCEGQGGISGGQRQRIMIARAIAPKPKLLLFDEATSALDNKTQRQVAEALDRTGCTRVVIAHRLSTIRRCDRILVLEDGQIREDGTYDALIAKGGLFAELVERQRLDAEPAQPQA